MRSLDDHLRDPALGDWSSVPAAATEGCAGGSCGVLAHYALELDDDGVIRSCAARVRGRAAAYATASALCEEAVGRTVLDAARLGLGTLHPSFAALDEEDRERALVAEDGFHHALGQVLLARMDSGAHVWPACERSLAAVVAMSGGVDSAVALHLEHEADPRVAGVTLRLWIDPRAPDPEAACCAPGSVRRARATCHALGVPHLSLDLRRRFAARVVAPFVEEYRAGRTPNPCVGCNGGFRLAELVRAADVLGAPAVSTGHYVRRVDRDGTALVQRGVDERKDQSYMLATLPPAVTGRFRFPLGGSHKPAVRAMAEARGLEQARVAESQEVCFLGGGDYRSFLARAGALGPAGSIVTESGEELGRHDGIAGYTPGQRRGVGGRRPVRTPVDGPLYVLRTEPERGRVVVGPRERLGSTTVHLRDVRLHAATPAEVRVQVRYRARGAVGGRVEAGAEPGTAVVHLTEPVSAAAPGQVACLYDADGVVVGAGTIVADVAADVPSR